MATQTTEQLINYYANLLIYQYVSQLRAYNTVFIDVQPILMSQGFMSPLTDNEGNLIINNEGDAVYSDVTTEPILPLALQDAFTLSTAVGVQLNVLAEYIGGLRTNLQLNGTYLTFTDEQFSSYLSALAARNNLASDMGSISVFFSKYFPDEFSVYDLENMHMTFIYHLNPGDDPVAEAFITSGHLPVPMAVGATLIINPVAFAFFAFRTYNAVAQPDTTGYNFYIDTQVGKTLSYTNVLPVMT